MLRPLCSREGDPVPTVQEAGWAPGPVWTCAEILALTGIRFPGRPAQVVGFSRVFISAGTDMFFRKMRTETELFQSSVFSIITLTAVFYFLFLLLGLRFSMGQGIVFSKRHCYKDGSESALRVYPLPYRNWTAYQKNVPTYL
jgi:hypothetical protein